MIDRRCRRRHDCQRLFLSTLQIDAHAVCSTSLNCPEHIRPAHLASRQLRHHRHLDIRQPRRRPTIPRCARQRPCRALVVHQPARPIDRIHDHSQRTILIARAARIHSYPFCSSIPFQPLRYQHQRRRPSPFLKECLHHRLHRRVDRIDRVGLRSPIDAVQILSRESLRVDRASTCSNPDHRSMQPPLCLLVIQRSARNSFLRYNIARRISL